nr:MAG TPA: Repressor protein CI [Caudoviricetes sp.]
MAYEEFNKIFSKNLKFYFNEYDMTQAELAKRLNVGTTSVYNWCNGIKTPRMDKIDAMCGIFNCRRSDLMEDRNQLEEDHAYYTNPETAKIAQEIYENKDLSLLFDAAKNATPEDLQTVHTMLMALKKKERGEE